MSTSVVCFAYSFILNACFQIQVIDCSKFGLSVMMDDHKEEEAIAELTKAISFKPDLQLLHLRAAFFDSMGNTLATLRDCEAALCLDPNHSDTIDLYNRAQEKANSPSKAPSKA